MPAKEGRFRLHKEEILGGEGGDHSLFSVGLIFDFWNQPAHLFALFLWTSSVYPPQQSSLISLHHSGFFLQHRYLWKWDLQWDTFLLKFCLCFTSDRKTVFFSGFCITVFHLTSRYYQVPSGSKLPFIFPVHFHLSLQQYSSLCARIQLAPRRASCPASNSISLVTSSFPHSFSLQPPLLSCVSFCPWSWKIQRWYWICWYRKNKKNM